MIRTAGALLAVAVLAEWLAESFAQVEAWPIRFGGMLCALAAAALFVVAGAEHHLDRADAEHEDDGPLRDGAIPVAQLLDRERRGDIVRSDTIVGLRATAPVDAVVEELRGYEWDSRKS